MVTLLTSSLYQATQVRAYGMDFMDVISVGLETMFSVVLAENGYRAENGKSSIAGLVESCKVWFPDWREILYIVENVGPDDVNFGKPWCKITLSDIQKFGSDMVDAFSWAFDASSFLTEDGYNCIKSVVDHLYSSDSELKIFTDGGITISRAMRECMNNILKSKGLSQTVKSDIFADYVDDYGFISYKSPQEILRSTGMSWEEFASSFEPGYYYLCGYDVTQKRYFAIPLDPANAYVYGQTSGGYYTLVSYTNPQSLCSYFLQYGKGGMSYMEIMDSGLNQFAGSVRSWEIGGTSIGGRGGRIVGTGAPTTELIEFPYWTSNSTFKYRLSANFSDCYIMYPVDSTNSFKGVDLFYTHDGIIARNECIKYANMADLGASSSILAGVTLGDSELKVGLGTLDIIQNRLELDASASSDDIADIVAKANADVIDSIENTGSSISSAIKGLPRTIFDAFAGTLSVIVDGISDIIDGITGLPSAMYNFFKGILELIHRCLVNIENIAGIIKTAVVTIASDVVEGIKEGLIILFVPKAVDLSVFSDNIPVMHTIQSVKGLFDSVTSVSNIVSQDAPKVTLYLGASDVPFFKSVGNITVIDFKDFEKPIYNMNISIIGLVRIVTGFFALYVWGRWFLNSIPRMLRGYTTYSIAYDKFSERK